MTPSSAAISHSACVKASEIEQQAAEEEADALHRVLRAGEPRDPAEQLAAAFGEVALIADFEAVLVTILGDAGDALRDHHPGDGSRCAPAGIERRQHQQAGDLQDLARREHARNAEARRKPAAAEIGGDAGRFVKQEQERQRERRVAQAEEMQQHQHAQARRRPA